MAAKRIPKIPKKYIAECNRVVDAILDRFGEVEIECVQDSNEFDEVIFDNEDLFDDILSYIHAKVVRDYK